MLNAVLADDEPIIIRGLKKLIPWEKLGIRIIGEAWTGKGLLELIERHAPDLVVTDISMPDGNGIDVIRELQRRGLRTKVIFISAYQEFSYAKDALAYGAVEYLVKPVDQAMLADAVMKAVTQLQEENEEEFSRSKLALYERKDKSTQLEELFDRLTEGHIRSEEAERRLSLLDARFNSELYTVMALSLDRPQKGDGERWGEHEKRLVLFAVSNVVDEIIRQLADGLILRKADSLCMIVNHTCAQERRMLPLAEEMVQKVSFYLKTGASIGIGRPVGTIGGLKESYASAVSALKANYFFDGQKVIDWSVVTASDQAAAADPLDWGHAVFQALLTKDEAKLEEQLELLLDHAAALSQGRKEAAVTACYGILQELLKKLGEIGVVPKEAEHERKEWLQQMQAFTPYTKLRAFVTAKINSMQEQLMAASAGKEGQQLQAVKQYIEEHYGENITLDSIASMVFMNPYYFSSFFKKHTQQNFKQYVTEVRMKQAVKLLLQTDLMVYEIAEKVGYNNTRQFSDMFKKHFGKLPHEYKTQRQ